MRDDRGLAAGRNLVPAVLSYALQLLRPIEDDVDLPCHDVLCAILNHDDRPPSAVTSSFDEVGPGGPHDVFIPCE
jgi:hypothetical protein